MVTVIQPYLYEPIPVDVRTAIWRVVDHYLSDEAKHYESWNGRGFGDPEHMFLWLTLLHRWIRHVEVEKALDYIPFPRSIVEDMYYVIQHLRNCDLNDLCACGSMTPRKRMEDCLDNIQGWLTSHGSQGFSEQFVANDDDRF